MTALPPVIIHNLIPIAAIKILALVDISVPAWRITFRRCRWMRDPHGERIEFACNDVCFQNHGDARRFQEAAIAACREAAGL